MGNALQFDYYYGNEAAQYTFYRIPKLLIKDARFKKLSSDAKLLYGLMLDRMGLSIKNHWFDAQNRAYIYYSVDDIMSDLGCARATCTKIMDELDSKKGIGLIEKKRQGQGKPNIIYVKSFVVDKDYSSPEKQDKPDPLNPSFETVPMDLSGEGDIRESEVQNLNFKKFKSDISKNSDSELQEIQNLSPNYNNYNNTENNNIISINRSPSSCDDGMMDTSGYIALIKENLAYDFHMTHDKPWDRDCFETLYELIVETVCIERKTVRVCGADYPFEIVKNRFLKLTDEHLQYVMESLKNTTSKITDIKAYLLSALYNAPATMGNYYSLLAQHHIHEGIV